MEGEHHNSLGECRRIFAMLSEYLDAELPADACEQIAAHLKDCPPCVEFLESLKKTIAICRELQLEERPRPLSEQTRAQLRTAYQRALAACRGEASRSESLPQSE